MAEKITGYRELGEHEITIINGIKEAARGVGVIVDALHGEDFDARWLAIAKTDLQKGFMALVRAVAKPEGF